MMHIMKKLIVVLLAGIVGIIAGCGGGSGSGSTGGIVPVATTVIAGTASKGLIANGAVKVYAIASGSKAATPLQTGTTDANGQFSIDVGVYTGPVIVEISGVYTDEATGSQVTIASGSPMRAAIGAVSPASTRRIAVTPLTDLAYNLAQNVFTTENIAAANAHVSNVFKISDITSVEPVKPDAATLGTASADQKAYTLALATLSQMAKTNSVAGAAPSFSQIATLLDSFKTDLAASASAGLSVSDTTGFTTALSTLAAPNGPLPGLSTLPGLSDVVAALNNVGAITLKLTLTVETPPAGTAVGGIQGTVTFPSGATFGAFSAIGNATGSLADAGFAGSVLTFGVANATGFAGGDFGTILVDIAPGASPVAANFTLSNIKVIGPQGNTLNLNVSVR